MGQFTDAGSIMICWHRICTGRNARLLGFAAMICARRLQASTARATNIFTRHADALSFSEVDRAVGDAIAVKTVSTIFLAGLAQ
jgi:hypothetical protein